MKVQVQNLERIFDGKTRAVDGISFSLKGGQVFGFIGPNGAGKTTTMRIMATLDEPTSGDVLIDGISVVQRPEQARRSVGFVPDTLPDHRDISIHEYLDFFARAHGLKGGERHEVVEDIEVFTGVIGFREKHLNQLSKGMKQRVSLARALIHDPELLIMDEPAAGLDPKARIELRELIRALAEQGKAIFISSHILDELGEICDGVVIIEAGKLVGAGTMDELISHQQEAKRTLWLRSLAPMESLQKALLEFPHIEDVVILQQEAKVCLPTSDELCAELLAYLVGKQIPIIEMRHHRDDLEDVFMKATRGKLQ